MIIGYPKKFHGIGLVAFIDILGFSKEIENNWENIDDNPLSKLLDLKNNLPTIPHVINQYNISKKHKSGKVSTREYTCRVQTISDSIIVSIGFDDNFFWPDFHMGLKALFHNISKIWHNSLKAGFTVRGAIDFGKIYWDEKEIIGPAFLNVYRLEQVYAKTSRIILSSQINQQLNIIVNGIKESVLVTESIFKLLRKDNDGFLILNPHLLYESKAEKIELIDILKKLQKNAKLLDKEKYVPLLAVLNSKKNKLTIKDFGNY